MKQEKIILYANTAWYLFNFRLALAQHLSDLGYEVVLLAPYDKYVERLRALNFRVIVVDMRRSNLNPFKELVLIYQLYSILGKEKPDIVYNFTVKCVVYGSLAAMLIGIKRRVNAVAGLGTVFSSSKNSMKYLKPVVKALLKIALSGRNARLIVQNPDDLELFNSELKIVGQRIELIKGSGVSAGRFAVKSRAVDFNKSPAKVLFASRLLWSKGVGEFVEAARALKSSGNYVFIVAGDPDTGNPDAVPKEQLKDWEAEGVVTLLGHVDNMSGLLAQVDLMVLPSMYGEGVPRILIEAAASSLPLIAVDIPGSREIVKDGVNGYLVEKQDQEALNRAILSVFADIPRYIKMSQSSREIFLNEFEENHVIKQTVATILATKKAA